jgi:hypothetical protein
MSLNAVEKIEDAMERSKDILLPFDFKTWSRLAIITVFLGGFGFSNIFFNMPFPSGEYSSSGTNAMTGMVDPAPSTLGIAALGLVSAIILILVGFMYLSATFKFVMFSSLRDREVRIRRNIARNYVNGFKYFLFQLLMFAAGISLFIGWIGSFMVSPLLGLLLVLPAIPIAVLFAVFSGIVHDFALQEVIEEEKDFISAVKTALYSVTASWKQFGGYLLFRLIISMAIGVMSFFLLLVGTMVVAIPFVAASLLAASINSLLGIIVGLVGVMVWIIVMLYLNAPFRVYMYSYFVEMYDAFME